MRRLPGSGPYLTYLACVVRVCDCDSLVGMPKVIISSLDICSILMLL